MRRTEKGGICFIHRHQMSTFHSPKCTITDDAKTFHFMRYILPLPIKHPRILPSPEATFGACCEMSEFRLKLGEKLEGARRRDYDSFMHLAKQLL